MAAMPGTELSPSLMDARHKPCLALGGGSAEISFEHAWEAQAAVVVPSAVSELFLALLLLH